MYFEYLDVHVLRKYVSLIYSMETWDGWSEFLSMAIIGYTSQTFKRLQTDDVIGRYQMKVALYVAGR